MRGNGNVIADGDATPSLVDGTDFGTVSVGDTVIHTFTVSNDGLGTLTISKMKLPKGFELVEDLSRTIAPGASDSFQVQIATKHAGVKEGTLSFKSNDPDERAFDFKLSGTVAAASSSSASTEGLFGDAKSQFAGLIDPLFDLQQHSSLHGDGPGPWYDFDLL